MEHYAVKLVGTGCFDINITASLQSVQFRPHYPAEKHAPLTIFSFDTHDPPKEQTVYSGDLFYVK